VIRVVLLVAKVLYQKIGTYILTEGVSYVWDRIAKAKQKREGVHKDDGSGKSRGS